MAITRSIHTAAPQLMSIASERPAGADAHQIGVDRQYWDRQEVGHHDSTDGACPRRRGTRMRRRSDVRLRPNVLSSVLRRLISNCVNGVSRDAIDFILPEPIDVV